jgi:hypothetical protein
MTDKTVEEVLAEAAAATQALEVPPAKKERVKKTLEGGTVAQKEPKVPKAPKEPKAPKAPKLYPQANEDGTQAFDEAGEPVMGPKETAYKAPKVKRESTGRSGKFPATAVITLLAEKNPKREGSAAHTRFELYVTGQTVAEALAAGLTTSGFHYDTSHGFISIDIGEVAEAAEA